MQPTNPDENPTTPLGDIWTPPPADTVDSTEPAPTRRRAGTTILGVAAAVLALVAAGAFGAVLAGGDSEQLGGLAASGTTDDDSSEDGTDDGNPLRDRLEKWAEKGRGPFMHHGGGPLGLGPMMGRGLHGSFVVEDPDGGYQTIVTQQGEATAVSDTSITVRSEDGYEATYRLTDDTTVLGGLDGTDSIDKGAQVAVTGVREDGSLRAVHVLDLSQMRERLERHLDDLRPPDDQPSEAPSGTATSGASV